jgi:hypothetical protein
VKQLLAIVVMAALSTVVQAQITCQTYGNTTNCNGSLGGSTISDNGAFNSNLANIASQNFGPTAITNQNLTAAQTQLVQQQAQAQAMQNQIMQARLTAQQAEYVRLQTEALQRQQQQNEAPQRQQRTKSQGRSDSLRCTAVHNLCEARDVTCDGFRNQLTKDGIVCPDVSAPTPAPVQYDPTPQASPSGPRSQFRQKWSALDDALANGVLTRAEYDTKLSALLEQHRRNSSDR